MEKFPSVKHSGWVNGRKLRCIILLLCVALLSADFTSLAAPDKELNIQQNQALPIESNEITNWPDGPVTGAHSAVLMDLETGVILYEKNMHAKEYPASTTKILTTLIASEECELDDTVSFSHEAIYGIPSDSNHVAMNEGDTLTMEQCLQAILIRSANEVSYAVAEHISGSWDAFADKMNERAAELGCVDSHFVNPNGLPEENHYTSAYDLAMIGRAFFSNEMLCQITQMPLLRLQKKNGELVDANQMELLPGKKYAYQYIVGCKTGYTEAARSCLVSCAEKDGMKLVCVVLRDEAPYQYEDTIALFNYGFSNFEKINIARTETKYNIENTGFYSDNDVFGNSRPILALNQEDYIIVPKTISFQDINSEITYSTENSSQVAVLNYYYKDVFLGSASIDFVTAQADAYHFDSIEQKEKKPAVPSVIFINILKVLAWAIGILALLVLLCFLYRSYRIYQIKHPNSRRNWKKDRRKQHSYSVSRKSEQMTQRKDAIRQAKHRQKKKRRTRKDNKRRLDF